MNTFGVEVSEHICVLANIFSGCVKKPKRLFLVFWFVFQNEEYTSVCILKWCGVSFLICIFNSL